MNKQDACMSPPATSNGSLSARIGESGSAKHEAADCAQKACCGCGLPSTKNEVWEKKPGRSMRSCARFAAAKGIQEEAARVSPPVVFTEND